MAGLTDFAENKVVDALWRAQAIGTPATWYFGLYTATPGETGGGTEVSGGSYARIGVTAALANFAGTQSAGSTVASSGTGGQTSNNGTITYAAPSANWGVVSQMGVFDAVSAGNLWTFGTITPSAKTINNGDAAPSYAAAAWTWTID